MGGVGKEGEGKKIWGEFVTHMKGDKDKGQG